MEIIHLFLCSLNLIFDFGNLFLKSFASYLLNRIRFLRWQTLCLWGQLNQFCWFLCNKHFNHFELIFNHWHFIILCGRYDWLNSIAAYLSYPPLVCFISILRSFVNLFLVNLSILFLCKFTPASSWCIKIWHSRLANE